MTIQQLFLDYPYLSRKEVAVKSGISHVLIRKYATGQQEPSHTRRLHILQTVRQIGEELATIPVK